ncbi:MAG: condensation domain-containing protein [Caulobacterales bacterium]
MTTRADADPLGHADPSPDFADFPASPIQLRLWREEQLNPASAARNVAVRWRLEGPIDPASIRAAFDVLTARHESLRTLFTMTGGKLMQRVRQGHQPAFGIVDLTRFAIEEREPQAIAIGEKEARTGFDLHAEPPWRATLLVLRPDCAILLVTLHGMISDGWSIGVLARELGTVIEARASGHAARLPELPLQYVDYSLWQNECLAGSAFDADLDYWRQQSANAPLAAIPYDPVSPPQDNAAPIVSMLLPESVTAGLERECKLTGVSMFSAAAAALALVLRARSDSDQVVIGTQVAGRDVVDLENIVGPLANTLLLNLDASGNPSLRVLLKRIGAYVREALAHQTAPFEASARPYQTNLIVQRSFIENARYGNINLIDLPSHSAGALYDLSFFMIGRPEGWRISCEYDPARFSEDTALTLLAAWRAAFESFVEAPQMRLHALDPDIKPVRADDAALFPCTPPQVRCWFLDQLNPGSPALNIPIAWELRGPLASKHLETALKIIISRHEILRTRIIAQETGPAQQIADAVEFKLDRVDLSHLPADALQTEIHKLRRAFAQAPFDLTVPPLMRAMLVRTSASISHLIVVFHQSVFDGWSIRVFATELGSLLHTLREGRTPDLPPLHLQYADFAVAQQARLKSAAFEESRDYWLSHLADAPYFEVSPDHPRAASRTTQSAIASDKLSGALAARLDAAAQTLGVTTFAFGCATVGAALQAFTRENDIVIGTQAAARGEVDEEALIGVFINNLVLRLRPSATGSLADCVFDANERVTAALAHQDMPFDHLVELLKPPRDPSRTPLIAVNVVVRRTFLEAARFGDLEFVAAAPATSTDALYDLSFELVGVQDEWRLHIEYNTSLYATSTIEQLLSLWRRVIENAIIDPAVRLSTFTTERDRSAAQISNPLDDPAAALIADVLRASGQVEDVVVRLQPGLTGAEFYRAMVTPHPDVTISLERLPDALLNALRDNAATADAQIDISVYLRLPKSADGAIAWPNRQPTRPATPAATTSPAQRPEPQHANAEKTIAGIWASLLRVADVNPEDNFFELGGYSLLALRMLADVKKQLGWAPNVAVLFREPTLRAFARHAVTHSPIASREQHTAPASDPLPEGGANAEIFEIQPFGDKTPIIAINNTVIYYNLAQRIGVDRPFIGIQMYDPEQPRELAFQTLETIASSFVDAIRRVRPSGPYILLGLCVSGAIALEVAQQLRRAGEDVPLIIQADATSPNYLRAAPRGRRFLHSMIYRLRVAGRHIARVAKGEISLSYVLGSYQIFNRAGLTPLLIRLGWLKQSDLGEAWSNLWFQPMLEEARRHYVPRRYDGDVAVFLSDEVGAEFLDPDLGWRRHVTGELVVARAPGWHAEIFIGKGADIIAETLRPMLEAIDGVKALR